jgi:hypothetical protein
MAVQRLHRFLIVLNGRRPRIVTVADARFVVTHRFQMLANPHQDLHRLLFSLFVRRGIHSMTFSTEM